MQASSMRADLEHGLEVAALAVLHDDVRVLGVLIHLMETHDAAALLMKKRMCAQRIRIKMHIGITQMLCAGAHVTGSTQNLTAPGPG